jgi:hypothetical protein
MILLSNKVIYKQTTKYALKSRNQYKTHLCNSNNTNNLD